MDRKKLSIVLLLCIFVSVCGGCGNPKNKLEKHSESMVRIDSTLQKLFARHQVDEKSIKTRRVPGGGGTFSRVERKCFVGADFNTLNFNHDLSKAVAEYGATVIATEQSENKSVTMHIKQDDLILQSIIFVVRKETPR